MLARLARPIFSNRSRSLYTRSFDTTLTTTNTKKLYTGAILAGVGSTAAAVTIFGDNDLSLHIANI